MKIADVIRYLEQIAPPEYQEDYDNAGLITGDATAQATGIICCLDSTEAVVEEAVAKGCNLIVAHHPIVFRGLKRLTGSNYVERTVMSAIRQGIAIYAIHTNLDNVYHHGVNGKIAERLGLQDTEILAPKGVRRQLTVRNPREGLADEICNLSTPAASVVLQKQTDGSLAVIFDHVLTGKILNQLDEAQDYSLQPVLNKAGHIGSGMIGHLPEPMAEMDFLRFLKDRMQAGCVKYTSPLGRPIERVALCGGSGGFLLPAAVSRSADIFITSDYKYHEYFDADGQIVIADIGHFESEQFTIELLVDLLSAKFPNFAVRSTQVRTNPVQYL